MCERKIIQKGELFFTFLAHKAAEKALSKKTLIRIKDNRYVQNYGPRLARSFFQACKELTVEKTADHFKKTHWKDKFHDNSAHNITRLGTKTIKFFLKNSILEKVPHTPIVNSLSKEVITLISGGLIDSMMPEKSSYIELNLNNE